MARWQRGEGCAIVRSRGSAPVAHHARRHWAGALELGPGLTLTIAGSDELLLSFECGGKRFKHELVGRGRLRVRASPAAPVMADAETAATAAALQVAAFESRARALLPPVPTELQRAATVAARPRTARSLAGGRGARPKTAGSVMRGARPRTATNSGDVRFDCRPATSHGRPRGGATENQRDETGPARRPATSHGPAAGRHPGQFRPSTLRRPKSSPTLRFGVGSTGMSVGGVATPRLVRPGHHRNATGLPEMDRASIEVRPSPRSAASTAS